MRLHPARLHVFTDFDGTIARPDTLEFLTGRFGGGAELYRETGRLLAEGKLSLREAVARDIGSITVPFAEAAEALRRQVRIDPSFPPFAGWLGRVGVPLTILSAGFTEIVDLLLPAAARAGAEVRANRFAPGTWRCVFRDDTPQGHDKGEAVRAAARAGRFTVFVGDGFSDRGPARVADLVFARRGRSLAPWCREEGIPCHEFETFAEIHAALAARLETAA